MPTSGNYQLTTSRNSIIEDAAEVAGILDPDGGGLTSIQYTRIARYLNNMIKSWQADGMQVWIRKMFGIILEEGKISYSMSNVSSAYSEHSFANSYTRTTLTSGSGTAIVIPSTSGMVATSTFSGNPTRLAIEKTDGTYFFGQIASVDSATGLTLVAGGSDYLVGGNVYYYTDLAPRMSRVYGGYLRNQQGFDTPIKILTREEYNLFGVKNSQGTPTQIFYDMGFDNGTLYVFPVVNTNGYTLILEGMYPYQTFEDSSTAPDFPEEWQNAIIYGLAVEIGYRYGMDEKRLEKIEKVALYWRNLALGMSQEASVYLQPTVNWYGKE